MFSSEACWLQIRAALPLWPEKEGEAPEEYLDLDLLCILCWDEEMRDTKSRCGATLTPGLFLVQTVAAVNEVGRTLSVKLFEHGVCSRSLMVLNFSPDVILHPGREIWHHGIQSYSWR